MKKRKNSLYLSQIYENWIRNIVDELIRQQEDRSLLLNECYWMPLNNKCDELLKAYFRVGYALRKLQYLLYEKSKSLDFDHHLFFKEDMIEMFKFLKEQNITSSFIIKYHNKMELHFPGCFK